MPTGFENIPHVENLTEISDAVIPLPGHDGPVQIDFVSIDMDTAEAVQNRQYALWVSRQGLGQVTLSGGLVEVEGAFGRKAVDWTPVHRIVTPENVTYTIANGETPGPIDFVVSIETIEDHLVKHGLLAERSRMTNPAAMKTRTPDLSTIAPFDLTEGADDGAMIEVTIDTLTTEYVTLSIGAAEALQNREYIEWVSKNPDVNSVDLRGGKMTIQGDFDGLEEPWGPTYREVTAHNVVYVTRARHSEDTVRFMVDLTEIEDYLVDNGLLASSDRMIDPTPHQDERHPSPSPQATSPRP